MAISRYLSKNLIQVGLVLAMGVVCLVGGVVLYMNWPEDAVVASPNTSKVELADKKDVRQAVLEQLPMEQVENIKGTWADGQLSKIVLHEGGIISDGQKIIRVEDTAYAGKEVYMIDFTTKTMAVPNNMIIFADTETFGIVGYGLVD